MSQKNFIQQYGPWALIAGASKGIGEAYTRELAARGLNLVLLARGKEGLDRIAGEVSARHGVEVRTIAVDLASPDVLDQVRPQVQDLEIGLLLFNAVYSTMGDFYDSSLEDKLKTLDVNCRAPLLFVSEFGLPMKERGRGGILLMSSMSGFQGTAMVTTYAATKAFNTILAEGLWEEFRRYGVEVLCFVAGATKTPSFNEQTPQEKASMAMPMDPADVARQGIAALGKGPTRFAGFMNFLVNFVLRRLVTRKGAVRFFSHNTRKIYQ